jgi:broad specificity phosphatase PhoE
LNEIVGNHAGESVVVVSHGYVMRALLVAMGFATFDELPGGAIAHTGYIKYSKHESANVIELTELALANI